MSSEVDDFLSGAEETGERIDTSRPSPPTESDSRMEFDDPHRENSVVTNGAAGAHRARPGNGRYRREKVEVDSDLVDSAAPAAPFSDDREATARARRDAEQDAAGSAAVAETSGEGAHRNDGLHYAEDDELDDDNDAFFEQVGVASALDDEPVPYEPPPGSDDDFDIESIEQGAKRKRAVARTVGLLTVAAIVIGGGGYLAVTLVAGLLDSTREETEAQYAAPEWATEVSEPIEAGDFDDLFTDTPVFTVETEGDTYWVAAGIIDVTDEESTLYDSSDGEQLADVELGIEDFDYLVEFRHEGAPVVGLRTAEGITAIRDDGEVSEIEFDQGSLHTEGESPLVYDEDQQAHRIDFDEGLVEIQINNDLPIVAADDDLIYQVTGDGTLVTIPDGEDLEAEEVDMQAPIEAAEFTGWAGTGHGFAGAYWQTDSGDFLGVHDAETGEASAYVPVETDGRWQIGRGLTAATVDRYAISLITGEILAADPEIAGAYSHYAYTDDRRFFDSDEDQSYVYQEDSNVIGASGQTVFMRTATGNIVAFDRADGVA